MNSNDNHKIVVFAISKTVGKDPQDVRSYVTELINPTFHEVNGSVVSIDDVKYGSVSRAFEISSYPTAENILHKIPRNEKAIWQIEKFYK